MDDFVAIYHLVDIILSQGDISFFRQYISGDIPNGYLLKDEKPISIAKIQNIRMSGIMPEANCICAEIFIKTMSFSISS
jgi:hypothetical protein